MLTNFDGVDFERPIKAFAEATSKFSEADLHAKMGEVAVEGATDDSEPYFTQGFELRRQYEGMNDEQRKGFDAALIALTGWSYESIVNNAIEQAEGGHE